jgi:hypothetical protein
MVPDKRHDNCFRGMLRVAVLLVLLIIPARAGVRTEGHARMNPASGETVQVKGNHPGQERCGNNLPRPLSHTVGRNGNKQVSFRNLK